MSRLKLRTKLFVTYIAAGIVPVILVCLWSYYNDNRSIMESVARTFTLARTVVTEDLAARDQYVHAVGRRAAACPDIAAGLETGDTAALQALGRRLLEQAPLLTFITLARTDGTVVARGHSDQAGDSIQNQATFQAAAAGRETLAMESGTVAKLTVRGAYPVFRDGKQVGVVSLGYTPATSEFVDRIKKILNVECTVFGGDTRMATTIINNGQRAVGTKMTSPAVLETVLRRGQPFQDQSVILGVPYDTAYWPLRDIKNEVVGMFFIGIPASEYQAAQRQVLLINLAAIAATIVVMLMVGWFMSRLISGPINRAVDLLADSTGLVGKAAYEIDGACQKLAESSSSQSASLVESSAALEELASQSKGNAANSVKASQVMNQTYESAQAAATSMTEMTETMANIRSSSDQVSGIIKTIEDISFQTNLLALNASVEAARAGEHGLGFAVVAEEVRNLAQRAAEAAGNTNALISASVSFSRKGEIVAHQVSESIDSTLASTQQVNALVKGVETASNEQSIGISQINQAVTVMDNAVQEISATSQSTAAISRELTRQSDALEEVMLDLAALVDEKKAAALKHRP